MSTIDPTLAVKARRARVPRLGYVVFLLVLHCVGGFGNGYGWPLFATLDDGVSGEPDPLAILGIVVGLPVVILASIAWMSVLLKRSDVGLGYAFACFWLGGGLGLLAASTRFETLTPVLQVVGLVALAIALAFALIGLRAARARRAAAAMAAEMMRSGTRTVATVSDKGYDIFRESSRILTTVTFTFTDLQGVQRWVQRPMLVTADAPLVEGQETDLWFDPTAPGDDRRIVVKLAVDSPMR